MRSILTLTACLASCCFSNAADPADAKEPELPRVSFFLQGYRPGNNREAAFMQFEKRLNAIPGVESSISEDGGFISTGVFRVSVTYDPAKSNLGDHAKAIAAGGARGLLHLFPEKEITAVQLAKARTAILKVKGTTEVSCPHGPHNLYVAVKPGGGAKIDEILAAAKTAGLDLNLWRK
jgi:hypothetical protein